MVAMGHDGYMLVGQWSGSSRGLIMNIERLRRRIAPGKCFPISSQRLIVSILLCTLSVSISGCGGMPILSELSAPGDVVDTESAPARPSVLALVNHVNCELQHAITNGLAGQNAKDFARLIEYNFMATIDLTVKVTNSESATPSLSSIAPFTHMGTNFTLTVGGQVAGSQDRDFDFTYYVDLADLATSSNVSDASKIESNIKFEKSAATRPADSLAELCLRERKDLSGSSIPEITDDLGLHGPRDPSAAGIAGDLGLQDILQNGLAAIGATSSFNEYGTQGPTAPQQDVQKINESADKLAAVAKSASGKPTLSAAQTQTALAAIRTSKPQLEALQNKAAPLSVEESMHVQKYVDALDTLDQKLNPRLPRSKQEEISEAYDTAVALTSAPSGPVPVAAAPAGQSPPANTPTAKFGSTVDFNIVMGINGGPNWTLTYFKGPGGGGGGGGGAGGSGGASSGAGGGGGGGSGPLSFSHTYFDTLAIAFVATCQDGTTSVTPSNFWSTVPSCSDPHARANATSQGDALLQQMELQPLRQLVLP